MTSAQANISSTFGTNLNDATSSSIAPATSTVSNSYSSTSLTLSHNTTTFVSTPSHTQTAIKDTSTTSVSTLSSTQATIADISATTISAPSSTPTAITDTSTASVSTSSSTQAVVADTSSTIVSTSSSKQATVADVTTTPVSTSSSTHVTATDTSATPRTTTADLNIRTTKPTQSTTSKKTTANVTSPSVSLTSANSTTHSRENGVTIGLTNTTLYSTISVALPITTSASTNDTEVSKLTSVDCSKVVVLAVSVSVIVWAVTVIILAIVMLRMRRWWKHRLDEERQRTDIWSMSTYHNTIINDNFLDYRLAPTTRGKRDSDTNSNQHTARLKQGRLSGGPLSRASSIYNDDYSFRQSIIRRSTLSDDERFRLPRSNKTRAKRQPSEPSSDYWQEQSSDYRPRTSTFTIGKRDKRDKHALINQDQLRIVGSQSFSGINMLEKQSDETSAGKEQPSYYHVTEL